MIKSHIILAFGWILYCAIHSVSASPWFKNSAKNWMGRQFNFYRIYYGVFASLSLAGILVLMVRTSSPLLFQPSTFTFIAGSSVTLAGLTVMGICIVKYFMQLSGVRQFGEKKISNELMITGIHKWVRHPLYSGTFIFIWGLFIIFPLASGLLSDLVITVYTLIGLRFEEKKLEQEFGTAYKLYKKKVPMLIPRIV